MNAAAQTVAPKNSAAAPHQSARPVETVDAFARRTGQSNSAPVQPRVPLSDISFPRQTRNKAAVRFAVRVVDTFIVLAVILAGIWNAYVGLNNNSLIAPLTAGVLGAAGFLAALHLMKAHQFPPTETWAEHIKKVALASCAALGLWLAAALLLRPDTFLPDALAFSGLLATAALLIVHSLYFIQVKRLHEKGQLIPNIVMLGATEAARRLIEENARTRDLNILAIFDERLSRAPHNIHGVPVVGKIEDLTSWDALPYIDRIIVTLPAMAEERKQAFVEQVRLLPNRIAFVVDAFENLDHVQQRLTQIAEIRTREVTGTPKPGYHTALKRLMDIGVSVLALAIGAPFLLLIAALIKLDSPGPALFKQRRHGFNNREFFVFKFRSLRVESEDKDARSQVVAGDSRVTKIGRFIRKTSIDELPQLFNVIKGDMSLVGPRPHAVGMHTGEVETYRLVEEYAHRHKVKPGMTGWAQINGSRGPLHDAASVARRISLDLEYIERSNIFFDLYIIAMTIPCLLGDSENIR